MTEAPWDQRLGRVLVRPLARAPVHPNHVMALGLCSGLAAAAAGGSVAAGLGAPLYAQWMAVRRQ